MKVSVYFFKDLREVIIFKSLESWFQKLLSD